MASSHTRTTASNGLLSAALDRGRATGSDDDLARAIRLLRRRQLDRADVRRKLVELAERREARR